MNYQETRDNEQLRFLDETITEFLRDRPPQSQTIIFFPGGLASRLLRAKTPYDANISAPQSFDFDGQEVWLSAWTFGHPELNALKLRMHKGADRFYHDADDRIIVADGCIKFAGITPYDDFAGWCKDNGIGLLIFGWDWRRPLGDTVTFFLDKFLPHLNSRLGSAGPLKNYTLVGHSFGGMIVNLILKSGKRLDGMNRAITVATPFYGYGGQIHRWFEGESLLNHLGENKIDIIKTLSSLPSSYTLNWLGEDTFNAIRERLGAGDFAIQDYPSKDRADPYNPPDPDRNGKVRYATHLGFSIDELKLGRDVCKQLAAELPDDLAKKFFNIRGVQTGFDLETPLKQTICGTSWQLIDPNFDPRRQDSPVTDDLGAGDEVLPAWSTHLVTLPSDNRKTVKGILHHSFILSSGKVQDALGGLLGLASPTQRVNEELNDELSGKGAASKADAEKFVQELNNFFQNPKRNFPQVVGRLKDDAGDFVERLGKFLQDPKSTSVQPDEILANVLGVVAAARGFSDDSLRSIARRIMMELCR